MRRFPGWAATALLAPSRQRSGESRLHIRYLPSYNKTIPHRAVSSNDKTSLNLGKRERMQTVGGTSATRSNLRARIMMGQVYELLVKFSI